MFNTKTRRDGNDDAAEFSENCWMVLTEISHTKRGKEKFITVSVRGQPSLTTYYYVGVMCGDLMMQLGYFVLDAVEVC